MNNKEILHEHKRFDNINYEGQLVEGREFYDCTFYKCNLKECSFHKCTFEKCTFEDCDLSLIKVKGTLITELQVVNSKAIGVLWCDAIDPFSICFDNSQLSYSNFYSKNLKKSRFVKCIVQEVDFSDCNLSQADFAGADLRNSKFFNTDVTKANFVGAENYFIDPGTNKIKNARFSLPGALSFLQALDIVLVE